MTLSVPLSVRIKTTRADTNVTREVRDLSFRISIPGGFASATIQLDRPLDLTPDDIEVFANVFVYDSRNGTTIWEGRLEDPGRGVNDNGEVWSISAIGPQSHMSDRNQGAIYVDRSLDRWERSQYSTNGAQTDKGERDVDTPCLSVRAEEGTAVPLTWAGDWIYRAINFTGQKLGRVRANHIEGGASVSYQVGCYVRAGSATGAFVGLDDWRITEGFVGGTYGSAGWVDGVDNVSLAAIRNGTATTANTSAWADFYEVVVRSCLKNADGTDITSAYSVNNVDPAEVVADLLGRWLVQYDGAGAVIIGSGIDIDQLAYPDGVTPAQIMDDLAVFDPGYYWAVWESNVAGKYRFEYIPWPTTVRYDATVIDGFDSPGSAADLYNRVMVRWTDAHGKARSTIRTQVVAELNDRGITRQSYIDLSDEVGSSVNATTVGDSFLAEHKYPPNAGTLTVARPILDSLTGRMVMPWEILPGHLIRVRGVLPRVDSLNPTARDGVTVFKVVSVDFNAAAVAATLELDSHSRTVARALASLYKRRLRKR